MDTVFGKLCFECLITGISGNGWLKGIFFIITIIYLYFYEILTINDELSVQETYILTNFFVVILQITELENKVSVLKDQNSQLETNLMKLQLELERREHFTREQEKIIKSRNELINTLKGKGKKTSEEIAGLKAVAQEHEKVAEAVRI